MTSKGPEAGWNELEFVSWKEFKRMAPSILQLEVLRLSRAIDIVSEDVNVRNILVKTRYELKKFIANLEQTENPPLSEESMTHLRNAALIITVENVASNEKLSYIINYIADRLNYIYQKISLIY